MDIQKRLEQVRKLMSEKNIDIYLIPTSDFHMTEFICDYFKEREFLSGFSGSAGTLVITKKETRLWTDGRYFLQAEEQLSGSTIKLMKTGMPKTPTVYEYITKNIKKGSVLGFDGRVMATDVAKTYEKLVQERGASMATDCDIVDKLWSDRPPLPSGKAWLLSDEISGKSRKEKLDDIRAYIKQKGYNEIFISSLDEIGWLLNMRGSDILSFPVVICFLQIMASEAVIFIDESKLSAEIKKVFASENIKIRPYADAFKYESSITSLRDIGIMESTVIASDFEMLNYAIYKRLSKKGKLIDDKLPISLWKACKNDIEIKNTKNAHIKDGVAVTKLIYKIKKWVAEVGKASKSETGSGTDKELSELDVVSMLLKEREKQEGFIEPSFDTIVGYGKNAAIVHYNPLAVNEKTYLEKSGFLLIDSGGHYIDGTTDVTRTISLLDLTAEQKRNYTAVLKGMINLSRQKFLKGMTGAGLDILARSSLWNLGLDYNHGTGHGVGHILAVHEGPNAFRWRVLASENPELAEGMITSNEPGFYKNGEYGIRIENELLVTKDKKTEYGEFLKFETLTLVPIDTDAIEKDMLTADEKSWLNKYHKEVYKKLAPFLNKDEKEWLKGATSEV